MFLYFVKCFGNKQGCHGSTFGEHFGIRVPRVQQSIAICPESLIRHFGMIKTHKHRKNTFKNQEITKNA